MEPPNYLSFSITIYLSLFLCTMPASLFHFSNLPKHILSLTTIIIIILSSTPLYITELPQLLSTIHYIHITPFSFIIFTQSPSPHLLLYSCNLYQSTLPFPLLSLTFIHFSALRIQPNPSSLLLSLPSSTLASPPSLLKCE